MSNGLNSTPSQDTRHIADISIPSLEPWAEDVFEAILAHGPLSGSCVLFDVDDTIGFASKKGNSPGRDYLLPGAAGLIARVVGAGALVGLASSRIYRPEGKEGGGWLDTFAETITEIQPQSSSSIGIISTRSNPDARTGVEDSILENVFKGLRISTGSERTEARERIEEFRRLLLETTATRSHEKTIGWACIMATIANIANNPEEYHNTADVFSPASRIASMLLDIRIRESHIFEPKVIFVDDQPLRAANFPVAGDVKQLGIRSGVVTADPYPHFFEGGDSTVMGAKRRIMAKADFDGSLEIAEVDEAVANHSKILVDPSGWSEFAKRIDSLTTIVVHEGRTLRNVIVNNLFFPTYLFGTDVDTEERIAVKLDKDAQLYEITDGEQRQESRRAMPSVDKALINEGFDPEVIVALRELIPKLQLGFKPKALFIGPNVTPLQFMMAAGGVVEVVEQSKQARTEIINLARRLDLESSLSILCDENGESDALTTQLDSDSYDIIVALNVMDLLGESTDMYAKILRAVKHGGKIAIGHFDHGIGTREQLILGRQSEQLGYGAEDLEVVIDEGHKKDHKWYSDDSSLFTIYKENVPDFARGKSMKNLTDILNVFASFN